MGQLRQVAKSACLKKWWARPSWTQNLGSHGGWWTKAAKVDLICMGLAAGPRWSRDGIRWRHAVPQGPSRGELSCQGVKKQSRTPLCIGCIVPPCAFFEDQKWLSQWQRPILPSSELNSPCHPGAPQGNQRDAECDTLIIARTCYERMAWL